MNFLKKGEEQRIQPRRAEEVIRKQVRYPMNDGSSGTINMIVGGIGGRMSQRGKKKGRRNGEKQMEIMQALVHTPMTISFSLKYA